MCIRDRLKMLKISGTAVWIGTSETFELGHLNKEGREVTHSARCQCQVNERRHRYCNNNNNNNSNHHNNTGVRLP